MKQIKRNCNLLIIVLFVAFFTSCENHKDPNETYSTFYVVRHAERHPGFNGHLTWYGHLRAGDLMRLLKDSGIQKIYVTPYSRTLETADSLRLLQKIDTVQYLPDTTGAGLVNSLKMHEDYGKKILIVGHGNTVPPIIRKLGASYAGDELPPGAFNLIFEIVNDHGKVRMKTSHYGRPELKNTLPMKMKAEDIMGVPLATDSLSGAER